MPDWKSQERQIYYLVKNMVDEMKEPLVILVTGASTGIGQAIARQLSDKGHCVYGTSRSSRESASFHWLKLDLLSGRSIQDAVHTIIRKEGRIDVLINNAGLSMISSVEEGPMESVNKVMNANFAGTLILTKTILPLMRAQGQGKIINISSVAGLIGLPFRSAYCASKFALEGLTESLRMEVQKHGIQICTIQPGSIKTKISQHRPSIQIPNSVYKEDLTVTEKKLNEEVLQGFDPKVVARKVEQIIYKPRLRSKYMVAKPYQKIITILKHLLPTRFYEWIIMNHYGIK